MGDRIDFANMRIMETGGIYVRTFPAADQITIDSKVIEKPGMFSNSIFVQSLLPNLHTVLVEKTGYYNYFKTISVLEKEVTKLENIILFKKNIQFAAIKNLTQSPFNTQEKFVIKNSNLYYSSVPENSTLTAIQKATPIIKKITAYAIQGNNIIWLGTDGFLYRSDSTNLAALPIKITLTAIKISIKATYKITLSDQNILLNNNGSLLIYNKDKNDFENFPATAGYGKIADCRWVNDYYVVFTTGDKVIISETDYRGNVNMITLPVETKNPQIFFNQQEEKLYILTGGTLLLSEKLIP